MPESLKLLHGGVYKAYSAGGDFAGLTLLAGVLGAIGRRYVNKPYRIRIKSKPEHALILGTILAIAVTGFGAEVWRIALQGRPDFEQWSFVSYPIAGLIRSEEHTSELQSLMRISYAVFCLKKKIKQSITYIQLTIEI